MPNNNEESKIIKSSFSQAKELLETYGEFYPFAIGINQTSDLFYINTHTGNDYPDTDAHISELTKAVNVSVKDNDLFAVALCVNVLIKPPYDEQKLKAIEIRINNSLGDSINYYIPYEIKEDSVEFYKLFEREGSLKIWEV